MSISRQSSVSLLYPTLTGASKALDGDLGTRYISGDHCSATDLTNIGQVKDQWWAVDLANILRPVNVMLFDALGSVIYVIVIYSKSLQILIYMEKKY